MPFLNNHGFPIPFALFGRPIMTTRSDQVHSEMSYSSEIPGLDSFQRQVFARFNDLSEASPDELLSISWISKLLDAFINCQEDFWTILCDNKGLLSKPPADRLASEYFDRAVKAMDIFNATRGGIETIRQWQVYLEIVVVAINNCPHKIVGEGNFRRARKALMDLALLMVNDKETSSMFSQGNRSFGRKGKDHQGTSSSGGHARSLSWGVSQNWSASKQLQSLTNSLVFPRAHEVSATSGLAVLIFSMSFILLFVLWVLVAAIPCQDRGIQSHFTFPRQYPWSTPLLLLHTRIIDESKKRDRRHSSGLLSEIYQMEKCVNQLTHLFDAAHFPLSEELKQEVREYVQELSLVCDSFKTGLDPLERKVREAFRKAMSCRNEGLEFIGKPSNCS